MQPQLFARKDHACILKVKGYNNIIMHQISSIIASYVTVMNYSQKWLRSVHASNPLTLIWSPPKTNERLTSRHFPCANVPGTRHVDTCPVTPSSSLLINKQVVLYYMSCFLYYVRALPVDTSYFCIGRWGSAFILYMYTLVCLLFETN